MKRRAFHQHLLASAGVTALAALSTQAWARPAPLLIYCGITMVRPITELARRFEQIEQVTMVVSQGGSEDLYQSLRKSRQGDLYLPGEPSYRDKYLPEGLLGDYKLLGYNQMAILVAKGNPHRVRPELSELLRKDLVLVLGNAQSGSVGQASKQMLDRYRLYPQAVGKAAFLMPDSRSLALSLKRGEADLTLNWRATAFFPDNAAALEAVDLPAEVAPRQALLLNRLTFSRQPELAQKFMDFAASAEGQAVFRRYGFIDAQGRGTGPAGP
jgi:molybdate transport system substrate-binding protein